MSRYQLPIMLIILMLLSACAAPQTAPDATATPYPFITATALINTPTATPEPSPTSQFAPSPTPLPLPSPSAPAFVAPVERLCPHRLTGVFLRLYSGELGIQAAFGCPESPDPDSSVQVWTVEAMYQDFERGRLLSLAPYGASTQSVIIALRNNNIFTRHSPGDVQETVTPQPGIAATAGPALLPSPTFPGANRPTPGVGLFAADAALRDFWETEPGIFEQFGYATGAAQGMQSEVLTLEQGELISLPELGIVLALRRGNPGAWSVYAYPES